MPGLEVGAGRGATGDADLIEDQLARHRVGGEGPHRASARTSAASSRQAARLLFGAHAFEIERYEPGLGHAKSPGVSERSAYANLSTMRAHDRNGLIRLCVIALVALALAGCGGKEPPADFVWLLGSEPGTIDPGLASDQTAGRVALNLFEGLTLHDADLRIIPGIARASGAARAMPGCRADRRRGG